MAGGSPAHALTIFTPLPRPQLVRRYAIALIAAILAILVRWSLDPVLGHVAFYVTLYISVAFCAIVCGFVPAVLSGILGFLGIFYWFIDPRHSLQFIRQQQIHSMVGAFLVCAVLTAMGEANRRKQLRLNGSILALTNEGRERKRAEDELRLAHDQLELRVQQRTRQLSETLVRLESEIAVRERTEEQLRHLSLRLMTLQDEERRRIARELHDTAGQTLAAIKMCASLIRQAEHSRPEVVRLIDELNTFADEALQEVRTTSYLLHPPLLDEAGIASAARWFVEGFARRSGIQVRCDIPERIDRPPRDHELVLFRVLQESLTNVHRHSGASSASIRLQCNPDHLKLEVGDNGKGIPEERLQSFNTSSDGAGVGIAGMRERVRELGGHLEIRSLNPGTTISVALPLAKSGSSQKPAALPVSH